MSFFKCLRKSQYLQATSYVVFEIPDKQDPSPQGVHVLVEKIRHTHIIIIKVASNKFHSRGREIAMGVRN